MNTAKTNLPILLLLASACTDSELKTEHDLEQMTLSQYCAANEGLYTCSSEEGFGVELLILPDCGSLIESQEKCSTTPPRLDQCLKAIEACPPEDIGKYMEERCGEMLICILRN